MVLGGLVNWFIKIGHKDYNFTESLKLLPRQLFS
jgi:hypothetical protein